VTRQWRRIEALTVTEDELREGIQIMDDAFAYVLAQHVDLKAAEAEAAASTNETEAAVEGQKAAP